MELWSHEIAYSENYQIYGLFFVWGCDSDLSTCYEEVMDEDVGVFDHESCQGCTYFWRYFSCFSESAYAADQSFFFRSAEELSDEGIAGLKNEAEFFLYDSVLFFKLFDEFIDSFDTLLNVDKFIMKVSEKIYSSLDELLGFLEDLLQITCPFCQYSQYWWVFSCEDLTCQLLSVERSYWCWNFVTESVLVLCLHLCDSFFWSFPYLVDLSSGKSLDKISDAFPTFFFFFPIFSFENWSKFITYQLLVQSLIFFALILPSFFEGVDNWLIIFLLNDPE